MVGGTVPLYHFCDASDGGDGYACDAGDLRDGQPALAQTGDAVPPGGLVELLEGVRGRAAGLLHGDGGGLLVGEARRCGRRVEGAVVVVTTAEGGPEGVDPEFGALPDNLLATFLDLGGSNSFEKPQSCFSQTKKALSFVSSPSG